MEGPIAVWKEGLAYKGPTTDMFGRVVKHELRLGRASSLGQLQEDYVFFSPAIVYLLGIVADQPLIDLMYEVRQDIPFYYKKFNWPIFARLHTPDGDTGWNHALWAVRREHWDCFVDFYCSVAIRVLRNNELFRIAMQEVTIVDPLAIERRGLTTGTAPTFKVHAFGVNGTRFIAAFEQKGDPLLDPPALKFYPPDEKTRVFARALEKGENPHIAEDLYVERQKFKELRNGQG